MSVEIPKTLEEITAMQNAYFQQGKVAGYKEWLDTMQRVVRKLELRANHWRQRRDDGSDVDVLIRFVTIQCDTYREVADWLEEMIAYEENSDQINLAG